MDDNRKNLFHLLIIHNIDHKHEQKSDNYEWD